MGAAIVALPFFARAQDKSLTPDPESPASDPAPEERTAPDERAPPVNTPAADDLTPPKAHDTPVEYPEGATGRAEVVLEITVNVAGEVTGASVASGAAPFDAAALAAAKKWRFEPA